MSSKSMAGWIGFAGILMLIIGGIDFFQGLIALFEDEYYVLTSSGFLVFDLTGWGWVMLIWGALLFLAGLGLLGGQGWARWFAIVVVALNFIAQLGFLGNSVPALVTDCDGVEHRRALRADGALERERSRAQRLPLTGTPGSRPSRAPCATASRATERLAGFGRASPRTSLPPSDQNAARAERDTPRINIRRSSFSGPRPIGGENRWSIARSPCTGVGRKWEGFVRPPGLGSLRQPLRGSRSSRRARRSRGSREASPRIRTRERRTESGSSG